MRIDKPDVTNQSKDYWEEVLESHRLGLRQLGLQERIENEEPTNERGLAEASKEN